MSVDNQPSLQIGSNVFYPAHGVAVVVGMEERSFGSDAQLFYALQLARGEKLLLPIDKVERAGVRELVSVPRARKLLKQVCEAPEQESSSSRRQRVTEYKERLRSGVADRYTSVLQELLFRSRSRKLANDEKNALQEARDYFVTEVGAVLDLSPAEIAEALA